MKAIHLALAYLIAPPALRNKRERGDITLQQVIWAAGIAVVAVAAVAFIVAAVNGYLNRIPL